MQNKSEIIIIIITQISVTLTSASRTYFAICLILTILLVGLHFAVAGTDHEFFKVDSKQIDYSNGLQSQDIMKSSSCKHNVYSIFAAISALLSLVHFVVLEFSVAFAGQIDDAQSVDPRAIPDWNKKINIPFAVLLGVFATAQFCCSVAIVLLNRGSGAGKVLYYCSVVGMLAAFAIGVNLSILSSQYNSGIRSIVKNQTALPTLIPFYATIQADSLLTFLLALPMLFFVFYYNLQDYLQEQRQAKAVLIGEQQGSVWQLSLLLLNSLAHVGFIYNVYQFTAIEDPHTYNLDNLADQYTFYIAVAAAVSLFSVALQLRHFQRSFLSKKQLILLAVVAALFQFGSFILMAVKAVQFHLDIALMKAGDCYFLDCDESGTFRWEITAYTAFTLIALLAQIPYFKAISLLPESQPRDTLLSQETNN